MRLPTIDSNGVPLCSENRCPSYDGKRCEETGFRPHTICEPEVIAMAAELRTLRGSRAQEGGAS
ncbi:hypothetical protein WMF38_57810 [Sorangium sp. So ce118]